MRARCVTGFVIALVASLAGCADLMSEVPLIGSQSSATTESELRSGLAVWAGSFSHLVTGASDSIRSESKLGSTRRNTLL